MGTADERAHAGGFVLSCDTPKKPYAFIDFPTGHKLTRESNPELHHPECSKQHGFLCDCAGLSMAIAAWKLCNSQWEAYIGQGDTDEQTE